jgi:hypothetical protein
MSYAEQKLFGGFCAKGMKERFLPARGFHKYLSSVVGCSVNRLEGLAAGAFLNREIAVKGKAIAGQTRSRQS